MAYATLTDLQNTGINPAALGSGITTTQQQAALNNASGMMDDYFGSRFTLPLIPPYPASLVQRCVDIAVYLLLKTRGFDPGQSLDVAIRQTYEDAMHWCEGVARRQINPPAIDSASPANSTPTPQAYPLRSQWNPGSWGRGRGGW